MLLTFQVGVGRPGLPGPGAGCGAAAVQIYKVKGKELVFTRSGTRVWR
jgi:hypothetical protein